jgi:ankyrin repeat protein
VVSPQIMDVFRLLVLVALLWSSGVLAQEPATEDSLIAAVYRGDADAVAKHLLDPDTVALELNPECPPHTRCKPITFAAEQPDTTILKMLLEAGADPNGTNSVGDNGLIMAIMNGNVEGIEMLLAHGGDVNQVNRFGISPFTGAVMSGSHDLVARFIEAGANPNLEIIFGGGDGQSPLRKPILALAIEFKHTKVVQALLEGGADPSCPDAIGRLPIDYAEHVGTPEIVALIRQAV